MAKKIYTKKLTYAGMSLCLLSFFAFILSAAGALADPVGKLVYNNVFTNKIDFLFTPDIFAYVNTYGLSCALAIFSLVAFFTSARAKGKKKLDGAFAGFLILFPLVVMITKGIMIYYVTVKGHFSNAITMGYDNDKFRVALSLADDVLPFIAAFLLFIGGLGRYRLSEKNAELLRKRGYFDKEVYVGIRPEDIFLQVKGMDDEMFQSSLAARLKVYEPDGAVSYLHLETAGK